MLLRKGFVAPQISRLCRSTGKNILQRKYNLKQNNKNNRQTLYQSLSTKSISTKHKEPTAFHDPSYNPEAAAMDAVFVNDINDDSFLLLSEVNNSVDGSIKRTPTKNNMKPDWSSFKRIAKIQRNHKLQQYGKQLRKPPPPTLSEREKYLIIQQFRKMVFYGDEEGALEFLNTSFKLDEHDANIKKTKFDCYVWLYGKRGGIDKTLLDKENFVDQKRLIKLEHLLTHWHAFKRSLGVEMFQSMVYYNKANVRHWNLRIHCCTTKAEAYNVFRFMIDTNKKLYRRMLTEDIVNNNSSKSLVVKPNESTFNQLLQFTHSAEERYEVIEQLMIKEHHVRPTTRTLELWIKQLMIEGYYPQAMDGVTNIIPDE